ncbi:hypothetical protein Tco_1292096 [Tanacetum coccineum]
MVDSTTLSEQQNEMNSSRNEYSRSGNENISYDNESSSSGDNASDAEKTLVDTVASDIEYADTGLSYDSDTVNEVHHDTFENVFPNGIQSHEQPDYIFDTYVVNENNSDIISDIPNMDPNREDNVNAGKHGLGFENKNDVENPSLLNKAKELDPSLYNIDEMGKDLLSDHKIISKEELQCEADKRLKVKQRKSPLSYHSFVCGLTQFEEPPKVTLKRRNVNLKKHLEQDQLRNYDPKLWKSLPMKYFCCVKQAMLKFETQTFSKLELNRDELFRMSFEQSYEQNINKRVRNRLCEEFEPLVKDVNLQLNCFEMGLVKEMQDDLKYVMCLKDEFDEKYEFSKQAADVKDEMTKRCAQYEQDFAKLEAHCISLEIKSQNQSLTSRQNGHVLSNKSDEAKIKFDTKDLETINIDLEHSVASLLKENEHLKMIYQNLFDSIKRSRIETIKKKKFDSRISNDFLQKSLYDYDPSNVESESREKKILFENETSSFETKIKELEMTLAQQTKDFKDANVDFSKKTENFETYFEKLENARVVLQRQLDQSKLASQDLLSIQKEYSDLRTSYNALKAKFDSLNWDKGKSPDRKFSKKPNVFETPTSQKVFKSSDSSGKKQVLMLQTIALHR